MEEFIFDDDVDEVGAEVEANCPKCRADTAHVVISKYEDEIRRVQCNPCGDVHPYRKPRGESSEEDQPEPAPKKKAQKAKPTWEQVMAKSKKQPRPYALAEYFKEMEILSHPKFGVGYVTENIGDDKIEVTFQADKRVLVHNRKGLNLPFSMLRPLNASGQKGKAQSGQAKKKGKAEPLATTKAAAPANQDKKKAAPNGATGRAIPATKVRAAAKTQKAAPAKKSAPKKVAQKAATARKAVSAKKPAAKAKAKAKAGKKR
jgi:hypothetical protein